MEASALWQLRNRACRLVAHADLSYCLKTPFHLVSVKRRGERLQFRAVEMDACVEKSLLRTKQDHSSVKKLFAFH
jgi:hypothetical protein